MNVIDGKAIAEQILAELGAKPAPKKFMAGIVIGNDPAAASFQILKQKTAAKLGIEYRIYNLEAELGNDGLRAKIGEIARHTTCGGVIVQLPLPDSVNRDYLLNAVPREKDVDVLGERALGAFYTGRNPVLPPVVGAVQAIAEHLAIDFAKQNVAVVGLGILIGKPIATWFMRKTKNLYLLRKESDFSVLKDADIVIVGTGAPGSVAPAMLKDGAGVIDFGYSAGADGKLLGDFDSSLEEANAKLAFYTPTPGGTGPILVGKLFENFYILNRDE